MTAWRPAWRWVLVGLAVACLTGAAGAGAAHLLELRDRVALLERRLGWLKEMVVEGEPWPAY